MNKKETKTISDEEKNSRFAKIEIHKKTRTSRSTTRAAEIEERYRQFVENSLEGLFIVQNNRIRFCNQRLAEIFGYADSAELIGADIKNLVAPQDWELVQTKIQNRLSGQTQLVHYEFLGVRKDGGFISLETLGSRIIYHGKAAIQGVIRDMTQHKQSQFALQQSEKKFRYLFESSPDAIYVLNAEGILLDVNLAASLLHEMGRSELLDRHFLEFVHPEAREQTREDFPALLSGEINYYETYVRTDSELKVPVELRSRRVIFSSETHTMFYVRDISDIVSVGRSFMESQRALSNFMSNLPGMAYRCLNDKKYTMKFVSNGSAGVTGYPPEDFLGNKRVAYADLILPEFRDYVWQEIQTAVAQRKPYQLEYQILAANNGKKWVWEQGRGVFDGDKLVALEGIILDITQQKQAAIALRESEKRFRSLIENVPSIAVVGYDPDHRIFFWNKAAEQFFGFSADEIFNRPLEDVIFPESNREEMRKSIDEWLKQGKTILPGETSLLRKNGSTFEAHSSHVMLRNSRNTPELYCLNVDLTELNKTKKDLQQSLHKLKQALDGTIRALTAAVEMRDPYTAGHQVGVAKLACAIARELGLPDEQIEGLRVASLLHDIGNLNVPAEILNKPGQLSEIEYSLLKTHPKFGYEILRTISFPWPIANTVLQHHERLDGSGYPQGLKSDDIMLEAKIIAVADVVEPMSSHRPYRPALGIDKAIEEIESGKGKRYDAKIVDACVRLIREKGFRFDNNH
ncbi:MAG: PAS domain S-box protein [Calditrichaeota bacterium]|nr:PAS domain S-box protein [Calditrichota bacterium]